MEVSSIILDSFNIFSNNSHIISTSFIFLILLLIFIFILYSNTKQRVVYLLDYACSLPSIEFRAPFAAIIEHTMIMYKHNPKAARFQLRILERAGVGEETSLPLVIHYIPPQPTIDMARDEAHILIFDAIDHLFKKTGIKPKDIGILITNCSLFCPSPSLSSIIVNKYKMRSSIKSFSLSGMGCSASPISVDLGRKLLQVCPNSYALVVSTEIITPNCYLGSERSMLIPAALFRMGCSAVLLTNKSSERHRAKYKLLHIVRTHLGSNNMAYNSVTQEEDTEGYLGISLSKDLLVIAGEALKSNITSLGPLVLPVSEKIRFVVHFLARKYLGPYVPNFGKVFDHFCIHAGGRAVIDELQKGLKLSAHQVEASRMVLHRFGNTSSSSIWYELSYIEAKERMKKGDHVWQIAFGSGFKCNSVVWKCNRNIEANVDGYGPWKDCVHRYPVSIPDKVEL
ncbi:3-ketoacyl-CoA synthase 5-like [Silene latifolia]|uniref:3-ketoacyl-CoA synthase 5-like n=1 Tax=Silene latifolia TaxID=37657 RepID=UPI003D777D9D